MCGCVGCCRRRKPDDQTTTPDYVNVVAAPAYPTDKTDSVEGTPPPEYCPRPDNAHQRARVKSRFDTNPDVMNQHGAGPRTEPGDVPGNPANRSLDKSGYADLGLGFDAAGTLPHGYTGPEAGETSLNRSLHHGPRRTNQTDTAPLSYVNRAFTDDSGVSDRPSRGRRRSSGADDAAARGQPRSRSPDDSTRAGAPGPEVSDWPEPGSKPSQNDTGRPHKKQRSGRRPDNAGLASDLPRDTGHRGSESPPGRRPGDQSFEIMTPGLDDKDLVPGKPFETSNEPRKGQRSQEPALNRLYPQLKPDPMSQMGGYVRRSYENLAPPSAGRGDSRLNRSFDPSSYLPDRSLVAGTRQGSAPDVRQRAGNATVQFNTDTQAIDV